MKRLSVCLLLLLAASCSRKTDQQLYREGVEAELRNDRTTALARYTDAVELAPGSAYAESSQYHIALLLTNVDGDKRRAAREQLRFHALFPASPEAPNMLFLAAFTYNNDLHMLDSARMLYTEFLEKYPGNKLASSAQFELEHLGKSPDELIRGHQADSAKALSE
jgi:TolA-binding protein